MIKDITLGQYYPVESPIHMLEARTKVLGVFAYLVGLFLVALGICNCGGCSWNSNKAVACSVLVHGARA